MAKQKGDGQRISREVRGLGSEPLSGGFLEGFSSSSACFSSSAPSPSVSKSQCLDKRKSFLDGVYHFAPH